MTKEWDQFPAASPVDVALQAEGITGKAADVARSIYQQESSSGKNAKTSNAGAVGGMQIIPDTFKAMADEGWDITDPIHNARAGVRYVKTMFDRSGGDPELTAAGYYGGEAGQDKAKKGIAVSDPRNPNAPNTLQYGKQVADRISKNPSKSPDAEKQTADSWDAFPVVDVKKPAAEPAKPIDPSTPKRSMMDELGHQLGLTARAGLKGALSVPGMVSDAVTGPINSAMDVYDEKRAPDLSELVTGKKKGFRFQTVSSAADNLMNKAGVAQPVNATERVVQDMSSAMAGAGGTIAAGKLLSKAAGPVAHAVGDLVTAGPGLQVVSSAAGSGASGAVREGGGSEGAQIAAGLAGSLVPGVGAAGAKAAMRGALRGGEAGRQKVAENIATFEKASGEVPTLGQATEGRVARGTESLLSKLPGGAGTMVRKGEQQLQSMGNAVQDVSDELAPGASSVSAGEAISKGIKSFKDGFKGIQKRLYDTLDKHIPPGSAIQVGNTEFKLKELNEGIEGAPNISQFFLNSKIKGIDKALQSDLELSMSGGTLPYEAVKKLRTLVGNEIADNSLIADVPRSKWTALYGALSDDLGVAAKKAGPEAEQSWQWANQFTKKQLGRLDELSSIVAKDTPEKVFTNAISGTAEGDTVVKRVISALPKQARREVAAAMLQRMGRAKAGVQGAAGDSFSSETFLTNLAKLSPAARETLFARTGVPGVMDSIMSAGKMAENIRNGSKVFANPSGTAQALTLKDAVFAAIGGLLTGNPGVAAFAVGGPAAAGVAAKLITNPAIVKFAAGKTALADGALASMVGATARTGQSSPPLPAESWDAYPIATPSGGHAVEPQLDALPAPAQLPPNGMAPGIPEDQPSAPEENMGVPQNTVSAPDSLEGDGQLPDEQAANHDFTSEQRPDGTLAIRGDAQALRTTLVAAGIPSHSIASTRDGILIGRTQAGKVQSAIDRMSAADQKPTDLATQDGVEQSAPVVAQATTAEDPSQRIQRLRDAGEEGMADVLQRRLDRDNTVASANAELDGYTAAAPDSEIHANPDFQSGYHGMRQAGMKPGEAAAHSAMHVGFNRFAQENGIPEKAVQAALDVAKQRPLAEVPVFLERYVKSLAARGLANPDAVEKVTKLLEGGRDHAMQVAMDSVYRQPDMPQPEQQVSMPDPAQAGPDVVADGQPANPQNEGTVPQNDQTDSAQSEPAPIDIAAHDAATSPINDKPEPTEAQKKAGNYALGHERIAGMDISIENPQGSVRRGIDLDGKPWETLMQHHYGYFKRTTATDGDKLDVFVKPGTPKDFKGPVFVVDQVNPQTQELDEHKVILGAKSEEEAKAIYQSNYAKDWKGMAAITSLPMPAFKAWAENGNKKESLGDLTQRIAPVDVKPEFIDAFRERLNTLRSLREQMAA